jgi:hypothetical protein
MKAASEVRERFNARRPDEPKDTVRSHEVSVSLIICTGGEYRGVRHDRHLSTASSFQIGVLRGSLPGFWSPQVSGQQNCDFLAPRLWAPKFRSRLVPFSGFCAAAIRDLWAVAPPLKSHDSHVAPGLRVDWRSCPN